MLHSKKTSHTASGALANSGIHHNPEEIPVQSACRTCSLREEAHCGFLVTMGQREDVTHYKHNVSAST
jgi:hypothetical protein